MTAEKDPALVFERAVAGPATHLLAIGIGSYPHLKDGSSDHRAAYDMRLGQLTSPPISAFELAQWFAAEYQCEDKPLASIGLVLSTQDDARLQWLGPNGPVTPPTGTLDEVKKAVKAWTKRAKDPRSRIILYFCGHGVAAGTQNFCLLRDFGADDDAPMANAINCNEFATALETRPASDQLLIFDSCRTSDRLVRANATGGASLIDALPDGRAGLDDPANQCVIFATGRDRTSAGVKNKRSLCASALIRGFEGAATAPDDDGAHHVTTLRLVEALDKFQRHGPDAAQVVEPPRPDMTRFALLNVRRFKEPPLIPVFVRCANRASLKGGHIQAQRLNATLEFDIEDGDEFETRLSQGEWRLSLTLRGVDHPEHPVLVTPIRALAAIGDPQ